jgi:SRSO17 transposase
VRHSQDAAVAAATVADEARSALLADLLERVAGCFPRRETRQCCGQMLGGLLMELDDHNCWTIAEAVGHRGPHRLQHLLSRAVWDDQQVLDIAAAWAASHLDDGDAVLIVDEPPMRSPRPTLSVRPASTPARSAVSGCARWR